MPTGIYNHKNTKTPIYTPERNKKISRALKGTKNPGAGKYKKSEEQRRKIKESNKGKHVGILNHWWKGGIWHNPYPEEWKDDIREAIRK